MILQTWYLCCFTSHTILPLRPRSIQTIRELFGEGYRVVNPDWALVLSNVTLASHLGSGDVASLPQLSKNESTDCKGIGIGCLAELAGLACRLVYTDFADAYIADIIKVRGGQDD